MQAMKQRSPGATRALLRAAARMKKVKTPPPLPNEKALANLGRLSRDIEQHDIRTVTYASFTPEISDQERVQIEAAAQGKAIDESLCPDAIALLAAVNDDIAPRMQDRLVKPLSHAGVRGHLANAAPYGPTVTRVVRVERERLALNGITFSQADMQDVVVSGRLSAVHRRFPDSLTRQSWEDAGVIFGRGEKLKQMELY